MKQLSLYAAAYKNIWAAEHAAALEYFWHILYSINTCIYLKGLNNMLVLFIKCIFFACAIVFACAARCDRRRRKARAYA